MNFYKTTVIAIFEQRLYHDIFFPCQALIILGSFNKIVPMRIGFQILPTRTRFWCCQWELGFKYFQWELGINIANENWAFGWINCHGFKPWALIMDLNSIDKIVFPWIWIMGFSNITKHEYSWTLEKISFYLAY